jgi:hypothetical protein
VNKKEKKPRQQGPGKKKEEDEASKPIKEEVQVRSLCLLYEYISIITDT